MRDFIEENVSVIVIALVGAAIMNQFFWLIQQLITKL